MALNSQNIGTLPPRKKPYRDDTVLNLCYHVGARRRRWFVLDRRTQKEITLGFYVHNAPQGSGSIGLAEARKLAREVKLRLESGVPPVAAEVKHPKDTGKTLGEVIDGYEQYRLDKAKSGEKKWKRGLKTLPEAMRTLRRNLKKYLDLPARNFSDDDLRTVRDEIKKRAPQMSDRFLAYLGPVMKWAKAEKHIPVNFMADVLKAGPGRVIRKRTLSHDEIRAIWHAQPETAQLQTYHRLVKFLLCCLQRKTEAATIRHGDIVDGRWKLAAEVTKSDRDHRLRLPQLALDQLGDGDAGTFAFPGEKKGGVMGNLSQLKDQLQELTGTSGWTLHDLRRSGSTWMQELVDEDDLPVIPRDVITAILNHAIDGADASYLHGTLATAKAKALALWADELARIIDEKPPQKVVPLRK